MKPMSNRLLVHTVTLSAAGAVDSDGNVTYGTAQTLTKVRVMPAKQTVMTALGEAKDDRVVLIYDCSASLPTGVTFKAGDKVTFGTDTLIVRAVDSPYADEATPAYYRVRLVGDGNES